MRRLPCRGAAEQVGPVPEQGRHFHEEKFQSPRGGAVFVEQERADRVLVDAVGFHRMTDKKRVDRALVSPVLARGDAFFPQPLPEPAHPHPAPL